MGGGVVSFALKMQECTQIKMMTEKKCVSGLRIIERALSIFSVKEKEIVKALSQIVKVMEQFDEYQDYLLGENEEINYVILLQNDNELRANGGFAGSYAVMNMKNGDFNIRFEDIYTPDGQLIGHVDPPEPIQRAFKQGGLRLRDADWEPDFPTTAKKFSWFFEKGNEVKPDILATLSFSGVKKVY